MILKDVTVRYCKLNPARPDRKMVPEGKWSLQMYTRDKAQSQAWRDAKIKVKLQEDDQGIIYTANLSKKAVKADKSPATPIEVVNGQRVAIDPNSIGNGSIVNIRIYQREYTDKETGVSGIHNMPMGIQVKKHIVYIPQSFEEFGDEETETVNPEGTEEADDDIPF